MKHQLVRYKHGKKTYEVVTKPGAVRKYRDGKLGWDNVLMVDAVFTNYKKGNVVREKELKAVFGTTDQLQAAKIIVDKGDAQVSASERKKDYNEHKKAVIGYIHRTYINEKGLPHPLSRLEGIVEESKVRLDPSKHVVKQAEEIVTKMRGVLIFKKSVMEYTLFLERKYVKKCEPIVHKNCDVQKTTDDSTGRTWALSIPHCNFDRLCTELTNITDGDFSLTV